MSRRGPNLRALGRTLSELKRMGRLEKVDEAEVQALRSMAAQLDVKASNAMLWKVYGEALERLTVDESSPAGDELLARLQSNPRDASAS